MAYHQQAATQSRPFGVAWAARAALSTILTAWIGRALFMLIQSTDWSGYESENTTANIYHAFQQALMLVPDTLSRALTITLNFLAPALLDVSNRGPTVLAPAWVFIAALFVLILVQAVLTVWVLAKRGRGDRAWVGPGNLYINEPRARFVYFFGTFCAVTLMGIVFLSISLVSGVLIFLAGLIIIGAPWISGAPLWFLEEIIRVDIPYVWRRLFPQKRRSYGSTRKDRGSSDKNHQNAGSNEGARERGDDQSWFREDRSDNAGRSYNANVPSNDAEAAYREALKIFDLEEKCTQKEAVNAYRNLMKRNHPDTGGSVELSKTVNLAFERIKVRRGWS